MTATVPDWIHIPMPGDHYSPGSGSSYATVIYELSRRHSARAGRSRVIVGRGTFNGYPPYDAGEAVEVDHRKYPRRSLRMLDTVAGAIGLNRFMKWRGYLATLSAIPERFDGWIFIHAEPAIVAPIKAARPCARIALYCHYELFQWYTGREVRRILSKSAAVICVSRVIREYIAAKAGTPWALSHVVPNGVDTDRFFPASVEPAGDPTILYVGRIEPEKGVHLLVSACCRLKQRGIRFRLRVVGGKHLSANAPISQYHQQVIAAAAELGDQACFTSFVDRNEIPSIFQSASIFCAPSIWDEPFGLTVAEAMASGIAVVVSRRGALPEVVGDSGVYFEPPDDIALADRLAELLSDPSRRRELAKAGRHRAMSYGWDGVYEQLTSALGATARR